MGKDIAKSEWKVLEFIWENPGSTIGAVRKAMEYTGWSYSTIKTLVNRLVKKDVVRAEDSPEGKRFTAAVSAEECRMQETQSFLDRIYNGSVKMMVTNLVKDSNLSDDDAKELLNLIDKMED